MNPTPLINRAKVKQLALACAQNRAKKFTRVGGDFYLSCQSVLMNHINARVAEGLYAPRKRELAEMLAEAARNTAKMQLSEVRVRGNIVAP